MCNTLPNSRIKLLLPIPGVVLLATWQVTIIVRPELDFFLGSPTGVSTAAFRLLANGQLIRDVALTSSEAVVGVVVGVGIGSCVGLGLWRIRSLAGLIQPYLSMLGAIPAFSLGPLIVFWLGTGWYSKACLVAFSTSLIAIFQAYTGATQVNQYLLKMGRAFGATEQQLFWHIVVPMSVNWVLAGVRLSIGASLVAAFVGELIASRGGIGYLIVVAEGMYDVNQIWVGVASLMALALCLHTIAGWIEARYGAFVLSSEAPDY